MKTFFISVVASAWGVGLNWLGMKLGIAGHFWFMFLLIFSVVYLVVPACELVWKRFHCFVP